MGLYVKVLPHGIRHWLGWIFRHKHMTSETVILRMFRDKGEESEVKQLEQE